MMLPRYENGSQGKLGGVATGHFEGFESSYPNHTPYRRKISFPIVPRIPQRIPAVKKCPSATPRNPGTSLRYSPIPPNFAMSNLKTHAARNAPQSGSP